jgi:hypothetical protein
MSVSTTVPAETGSIAPVDSAQNIDMTPPEAPATSSQQSNSMNAFPATIHSSDETTESTASIPTANNGQLSSLNVISRSLVGFSSNSSGSDGGGGGGGLGISDRITLDVGLSMPFVDLIVAIVTCYNQK